MPRKRLSKQAPRWDGRLETNPAFQLYGFLVDVIILGPTPAHGNEFHIMSYHVVPVVGSKPSVCPKAAPKLPVEYLGQVETRFRELGVVKEGQTIHWVGDQRKVETVCTCSLTSDIPPRPASEGPERRPAYGRDHWFFARHKEGLKPKAIAERWNDLPESTRKSICPRSWQNLTTLGQREVVKQGLKKARKEQQA